VSNSALNEARQLAQAHEWTQKRVLVELETLPLYDSELVQTCLVLGADLVTELREVMGNGDGLRSVRAGFLLLYLGYADGSNGVVAGLRADGPQVQLRTLVDLSLLPLEPETETTPQRRGLAVPLRSQAVWPVLEPYLYEPDTREGRLAIQCAMKLDLPEADQRVLGLLNYPSATVRADALFWTALKNQVVPSTWHTANALLFNEKPGTSNLYRVVSALEWYCGSPHSAEARQASDLLARFVSERQDQTGNEMANVISNALKGLAKSHYPHEVDILRGVIDWGADDWRRGAALQRLIKLAGKAETTRVIAALSEPKLRVYAARGINQVGNEISSIHLRDALIGAYYEETRQEVLGELVHAILAVDPQVLPLLRESLSRLRPFDVMKIVWLSQNITPRMAIARLTKEAGIPNLSSDLIDEAEKEWLETQDSGRVVMMLLYKVQRLCRFDCEAGVVPPDYVELLTKLVAIGQPVFNARLFSQQVDDETDESHIRFVLENKVHDFTTENIGDWYDVRAVLTGLNKSLAAEQKPERFIMLHTEDQTCAITFAREAEFREVARDLALPLAEDVEAAMKHGQAYEQYVLHQSGQNQ
jgi:hypothetical protein